LPRRQAAREGLLRQLVEQLATLDQTQLLALQAIVAVFKRDQAVF
jgi:hypothetical protein